jgi:hypothetical protein
MTAATTLTVGGRFCGPPGVANGGYLAGRLAALVGASTVSVRLRRPTPLDRSLDVRRDGPAVDLLADGEVLARAEPAELDLDLDVPFAPSVGEAAAAAAARPPRNRHPFPGCFGCGPDRSPGDAVAALLGPLAGRPDVWAGVWRPTAGLPHAGGNAAPESVWAALDCPSFQPVEPGDERPHVLGTLVARQDRPVRLDADHVLLAWVLRREDRRATSASAVIGPDGEICARARAMWFAVR